MGFALGIAGACYCCFVSELKTNEKWKKVENGRHQLNRRGFGANTKISNMECPRNLRAL